MPALAVAEASPPAAAAAAVGASAAAEVDGRASSLGSAAGKAAAGANEAVGGASVASVATVGSGAKVSEGDGLSRSAAACPTEQHCYRRLTKPDMQYSLWHCTSGRQQPTVHPKVRDHHCKCISHQQPLGFVYRISFVRARSTSDLGQRREHDGQLCVAPADVNGIPDLATPTGMTHM